MDVVLWIKSVLSFYGTEAARDASCESVIRFRWLGHFNAHDVTDDARSRDQALDVKH